jgi:hypothetical protein
MAVMEQTIEHRTNGGNIAQQLAPIFYRAIRGKQGTEPFVTAQHDLQ